MSIISLFFIILGIYVLYRLVFDLIIPVYKASRRVQEQFRNMHQQMHEQQHAGQQSTFSSTPVDHHTGSKDTKASSRDYIDFEEVKD